MLTHKNLRLSWPTGLAVLLVILGWAALPAAGDTYAAPVIPSDEQKLPPPTAGGSPEMGWNELVRSREAVLHARQSDLVDASLTVHLNLTDGSLAGSTATLQPVSASVTRDGYIAASGEGLPVPDPAGFFYHFKLIWQSYPCGADYCYPSKLEPGDQIYVSQGSLSQSINVPVLTALAEPGLAAPGEDSLYGQAPPGSALTAFVTPYADPAAIYTQTASAAGDGSYQISLAPAHDLHRQDSGYILLEMEPGVSAYRRFVAPLLRAQVGGATISGLAAPQEDIIITHTLASGEVVQVIQTSTSEQGGFSYQTELWEWEPDSLPLAPGDRVVASAAGQVFSMTLPVLSAKTYQESGQISGLAPPGAGVVVRYFDGPMPLELLLNGALDAIWDLEPDQQAVNVAAPGGEYTASLPVQTGDYGAAFVTLPDEHQAYARTSTVYLYTRLSDVSDYGAIHSLIAGQIDLPLSPITVSVRGPSGYLKDWQVGTTSGAGGFGYFGGYWDIWPKIDGGDVVEITAPGMDKIAFNVPVLTATANRNLSTVSGNAPPETRLTVAEHTYPFETRVVTSTADGAYSADFSNSLEFTDYSNGAVYLSTPEGHQVERPWRLPNCPPNLAGAQVGGNRVFVNVEDYCYDGMMRLWDASGALKKEAYLYDIWYSLEGPELRLYDENGVPILVLPGDRIEIEYGGESTSNTVPQLSVEMDPDTYLISGTAPPGARLEITRRDSEDLWTTTIVVTATQDGIYQASLGSGYTYQTGDRIEVSISRQPVKFITLTALPRLVVPIYSEPVYGWLPPLTPFQIHVNGPVTNASASGYADNDASFNAYLFTEDGENSLVTPGDHLELETPQGVHELTIPDLTARYDPLVARLSGQAPPGALLEILISYPSLSCHTTANADGEYQVDFPELEGAGVQGTLIYHSPADHQVTLAFATPHLELALDGLCAWGVAPYPSEAITLTVASANGSYQQTASQSAAWGNFTFCFERGFAAGDQLALSNAEGVLVEYQVPGITARHDFSGQVLLGSAPPGSAPSVLLSTEGYPITRYPLLEADGSFGMDTSDLFLKIGNSGRVTVGDLQGNLTHRDFMISGVMVFLPLVIQ